jgi:hypothetical protein
MASTKYLGTSDEVTTCDCCGRKNLKSTIALEVNDETVYYGLTCAASALGRTAKEVRTGARLADKAAADARTAEFRAKHASEDAAWQSFLDLAAPEFSKSFMNGPDRFRQIDKIGGYTAARAAFEAS